MRTVVVALLAGIAALFSYERSEWKPRVRIGNGLSLGAAVRAGNLEVWPVFADQVPKVGPYCSLQQAQARGVLSITEQENATVRTLMVENRGDVPILACAGAIFVGGKQDRQLGKDVVIAARAKVSVPTFCVERGRWSGGKEFRVAEAAASRRVRAAAQYDGDQSGVWKCVAESRAELGLGDGSYRDVAETRRERAEAVLAHLRGQRGNLVGYAYALDGKLMGLRTFAHPSLFRPRLASLVNAICAESGAARPRAAVDLRDRHVLTFRRECELRTQRSRSADVRRMKVFLQMSSDAFDRNEYDLAAAHARKVLALDPGNTSAQAMVRIVEQADERDVRERFNDEWRTVMAQIERDALPHPEIMRYPDAWIDNGGPGVNAGGAALAPTRGLFFSDGTDGDFNRNAYGNSTSGRHAAYLVKTGSGRWIPLVRDWTAK